jgi:nucleotide-binding universal stress UspA family protein
MFSRNPNNNEALQQAVSVSKINNADLTVVDVFDSPEDTLFSQVGNRYSHDQTYLIGDPNRQHRRDTLKKIKKAGIPVEHKYMPGGSHLKILEAVKQNDHDLVMVDAGESNDPIGFGTSTLMNLVRRCPVPLWIVKPKKVKSGRGGILAAVDPAPGPGPFTDSENVLNKQILQVAATVAKAHSGDIDIVHCWLQPMEDRLRRSSTTTENNLRNTLSQTRRRHKRWLSILLDSSKDEAFTYRMHLLKGKPHLMIPDFARRHQSDLVIMGNVSRAGVNGLFVGNTAEKILCRTDLSLLIIKPRAFFETIEHLPSPSEAACTFM